MNLRPVVVPGLAALALALGGCDRSDVLAPAPGEARYDWTASDITYAVAFQGAAYDSAQDRTTFTYRVTSNPAGGPAISHWVIGFDATPVVVASSDPAVSFGVDPTTGVRGVKFDTGYRDGETRTVTLTLAGEWKTGTVPIAVKAATGFVTGTTQGPVLSGQVSALFVQTYKVRGRVFFDVNRDGVQGADEPGLAGVPVRLSTGEGRTTDAGGAYVFDGVAPGSYTVFSAASAGLDATTPEAVAVTVAGADAGADFGGAVDVAALGGQVAGGYTIGYWKNNVDKALTGTTKGVQVSAATLRAYRAALSGFALEPLNVASLAEVQAILASTSPDPVSLLRKQLMASELNYASGAFIGGDERTTRLFLHRGEYLVKHAAEFTAAELLCAKDWFDAYNNSHGGAIVAPACGA